MTLGNMLSDGFLKLILIILAGCAVYMVYMKTWFYKRRFFCRAWGEMLDELISAGHYYVIAISALSNWAETIKENPKVLANRELMKKLSWLSGQVASCSDIKEELNNEKIRLIKLEFFYRKLHPSGTQLGYLLGTISHDIPELCDYSFDSVKCYYNEFIGPHIKSFNALIPEYQESIRALGYQKCYEYSMFVPINLP